MLNRQNKSKHNKMRFLLNQSSRLTSHLCMAVATLLWQMGKKRCMVCRDYSTERGCQFKTLTCSLKQQLTCHHIFQYATQPYGTVKFFVLRAFYKTIQSLPEVLRVPHLYLYLWAVHISLFHCIHRSGPVCVGFSMQYESICLHWRKIIAKQTNHLCHIEQASTPGA